MEVFMVHLSLRRNLGTVDRVLRIIIGLVIIYVAAFKPIAISGSVSILLWILGVLMLVEGLLMY
jgi:hypothetical protein